MACGRVPQTPAFIATRVCCKCAKTTRGAFAIDLERGRPHDLMPRRPKCLSRDYSCRPFPQYSSTIDSNVSVKRTSFIRSMATTVTGSAGQSELKDITMSGNTPKEKIRLQGVEQTLLPMLMFKYRDSQKETPILGDPYAKQLLDRCDIDLDATHFSATTDDRYVTWIVNRSKRFDNWCQEFLDAHQEPVTVLHLGCGLDCRYFRVQRRPDAQVRWIDLDQLMVVDLRNRLIPGPLEGDYALRTLDVTKDGWFRDVPADRPTIIIAEGLMPYLEPEAGQKLIQELVDYFGGEHKSQLVFDTLGSLSVKLTGYIKALKSSRAQFKWGVDEPEQILTLDPRLSMKDRILWREYMSGHPPFFGKYGTMAASVMPSFDKNIQFWRFEF